MKKIIYFMQFILLFWIIQPIYAADNFANQDEQRRYRNLIGQIRCPVCQGQSIKGSNADLARDLREKVKSMVKKGDDDETIKTFMIARYGDFVVFSPPLNKTTYFLWFTPFLLLIIGFLWLIKTHSNPTKKPKPPLNLDEAKKLLQD